MHHGSWRLKTKKAIEVLFKNTYDDDSFEEFDESLKEDTKYNTKSKEEYENNEEFRDAIHDDISTIKKCLEELKYKVNTNDSVELLNIYMDKINSELLGKAYK